MNTQLFEGELIRLGAIDAEHDAEIESKWTHDSDYLRALSADPMRALSPNQIKKKYEEMIKNERQYHFAIRARDDDRMIGFIRISGIEWTNGIAWLSFGIGDAAERGKGYAREALRLALAYAFGELNLYRLTAIAPEYNARARHLLECAGFVIEVRRRQAIARDGKRWDLLAYGMLREEWVKGNS
ncbi:MAG: GNAT family N-acetyltransferase [Chloroflexi bacterium]|nr:GNAT family N-acetyltransferase [Chloroflexota bacterium]